MEFEIINKEYLHKITTRKTNKQKKKDHHKMGKIVKNHAINPFYQNRIENKVF